MKSNDLLLYGGLAVVAYLFLKPKTVAPGVTQVAPVTAYIPPTAPNNTTNQLLTAAAGLAPALIKYLSPTPVATTPAQAAAYVQQAAAQNAQFVPAVNNSVPDMSSINIPAMPAPVDIYANVTTPDFTSSEMMFQNGDYPGASLSGMNDRIAACIGEF
jgi:hypothetical protein